MKQLLQKVAFVAAVCGSTLSMHGQATNSGDIRGTVTDSTGALLPDVTVTVTNVDTGITKVLQTNRDGLYDTSSIVIGTYRVSFEKDGFSKFERSSITLQVGVSTVNAAMKVGSTNQEVVVNSDIPLLETESGERETTLDAKSMQYLPNVGEDWQNFVILLPGSSSVGNTGQSASINGNLPYSNVLADGASTTLSHSQNSDVSVFESVAEVQVSTSAFSAQYGIGGVIFNQISKGGTSQFHGSGYDYFQSSQFAARQIQGAGQAVPYLRYNNFGGSVGGPVIVPHTNLRNKAFFYFLYDQVISHGSASNNTNDIPTADVLAGRFTGMNMQTIYDPTTQTIATDSAGHQYPVRQTFASEYGSNSIPTALWDKVAANFQKFYPTASNHIPGGNFVPGFVDNQGITRKNFYSSNPQSTPLRRYFGRFDYDVNARNRITASVTQRDTPVVYPNAVTACPIGCQSGDVDSKNGQVSDVWTISPHTINEARFGYTYQGNFFGDQTLGAGIPNQLGWQYAKADSLPAVQFTGNYPYAWIGPSSNAVYKEHVFDPSDVVTMIRGKHVLHFGGEFLIYQDNSTAWGNTNAGTFQFSGQYTQHWSLNAQGVASPDSDTGAPYADFLLGDSTNWNASVSPEYGARLKSPQLFVQDDYKVKPNLTLNLGVRYQIRKGWTETHGNIGTYDPTVVNPATGKPGAYWTATQAENGRTSLQSSKYSSVLPRVGFSWLPNPSMTVRGGFGMYDYNLSLDQYGGGLGSATSASGSYGDPTGGVIPGVKLGGNGTEVASGAPLPYTPASTNPARYNGQSIGYQQYDNPTPGIYQWNLGVQNAIGTNMVFDLAYVASHGRNLNFGTDINAVPDGLLLTNSQASRPNPTYTSINGNTTDGISNYNSLQATIQRRMAHGLSFNFNYTWSHFLDSQDSSGWGGRAGTTTAQYTTAAQNYSNSNFDTRNAFKGYAVYLLPFGKGKMFLNHSGLLDEIFGNYQISSTMEFDSGKPFSVVANDADTYKEPNTGSQSHPFANLTGVNVVPQGGRSRTFWFNPAAFSRPANGTFGSSRRNQFYGPGYEIVNISAGKKFDIYESVKLQLRLDATNAFNHVSLAGPSSGLSGVGSSGGNSYIPSGNPQITNEASPARFLQAGIRLEF